MSDKIEQPSQAGEYDEKLQRLLQLIWGDGFLSPGGPEEIDCLLAGHDIRGLAVLDIGAGLGAVDELLVRRHGAASVIGIDIDPELLRQMDRRIERARLSDRVHSVCVAPGPMPFTADSFDVVFSKDSMVQIPDKPAVFADIARVMRPGGRFIASDWLRGGSGPYSADMMEYFRLEGIAYNMASPAESAEALARAGFIDVTLRDRTDWYLALARRELDTLGGRLRPTITEQLGADQADHFVANWRQLVLVLATGELRPHYLVGSKPRPPVIT